MEMDKHEMVMRARRRRRRASWRAVETILSLMTQIASVSTARRGGFFGGGPYSVWSGLAPHHDAAASKK